MKLNKTIKRAFTAAVAVAISAFSIGCDFEYDLPEAGSKPDLTPPSAFFTYQQGVGFENEEWKTYTFANLSISATTYHWDFGNGETATTVDGFAAYPGEGTYTVTLTASDALGVVSTYSETFELVEPEAPAVPDPTIVNPDFVKQAKSSGSECSCSGWINKKLGDQGESSTGNGSDVVKFDNAEADIVYQEFAVEPNSLYSIEIVTQFKDPAGGSYPAKLEINVLAGTGYVDGYTPTYYTDPAVMPQGTDETGHWGYTSVAQATDPANNLFVKVQENPGDDGYITYTYTFDSGDNNSVALWIRGRGDTPGGDFDKWGHSSGDEEIRADYVKITAIND